MSITLESFKGHWAGVPYALAALLPGDSFLIVFHIIRSSRTSIGSDPVKMSKRQLAKLIGRSYNFTDKCVSSLIDLNLLKVAENSDGSTAFSINWEEVKCIHDLTAYVTDEGWLRLKGICNGEKECVPVSQVPEETLEMIKNNYKKAWTKDSNPADDFVVPLFEGVLHPVKHPSDGTQVGASPGEAPLSPDEAPTPIGASPGEAPLEKNEEVHHLVKHPETDNGVSNLNGGSDCLQPDGGASPGDAPCHFSASPGEAPTPLGASPREALYIDIIIDKKIDERAAGSQERITLNNGAMSEANSDIGLVLSIKENNNKYLQSSFDNFREFFGIIFGENFSEEFWEDFEEVNRKEFESHIHSQEEKEIFDFYMDRYDDYPALEDWKELISPRSTITTNMAELLRDAWDGLGYDEDDKEPALVPAKAFDNIVVHAVRRVKEESFEWRLDDRQVRSLFHFQPVLKNGELHFLVHPAFLRDIEKKRESETKDKPKRMSRAEYRMLRICFSDALTEICEKMGDDRLTDAEYAIILLRQRVARLTDANFVEVQTIAYDRYLKEIGEEVNIQPEELRRMWSAMPVRMKQVISPESIDPQLVFEYNRRSSKKASKVEELTWRLLQEWADEEKRREEEAEGEDEEGTETD